LLEKHFISRIEKNINSVAANALKGINSKETKTKEQLLQQQPKYNTL